MDEKTKKQFELLEKLYIEYKPALILLARKYSLDDFASEEVVHISFEEIIKHLELLSSLPCHKIKAYLVNTVRSRAINYLKAMKTQANIEDQEHVLASDHPDDNVERKVISILQYEECQEILKEIPEHYRTVLMLKSLSGKSDREIADLVGLSESSVRKYVQRAIEQFKKLAKRKGVSI